MVCDVPISRKLQEMRKGVHSGHSETISRFSRFILNLNVISTAVVNDGSQESMFISLVDLVDGPYGKIPFVIRTYAGYQQSEQAFTGGVYSFSLKSSLKAIKSRVNRKFAEISEFRDGLLNCSRPGVI